MKQNPKEDSMKHLMLGLSIIALPFVAAHAADGDPEAGQKIHQQACAACHGIGVAGAPKTGDKDAWAARIEQGMDTLVKHAIEGYTGESGVMPPKGGFSNLSDQEVADAVAYMVKQAK
jgi:cytochrome c5